MVYVLLVQVSRNISISSQFFSVFGFISFQKYSLKNPLNFIGIFVISFSSPILLTWVFILSLLVTLAEELVNLVYLFEAPTLLILCNVLLECILLISAPIFIISFHLLILGLSGSCYCRTLMYIIRLLEICSDFLT
jgi:hypothetical protein